MGAPERLASVLPFYYGWVIVGVGAAAVSSRVIGSVEAASVFAAALIAEHGWSTTLLAAPIFIGSSASALGGPFVGRLLDRRGPRLVTALGTALVGISCFVLAATNSILFYIAFYSLLRMTGQGMVQLSSQITAAKWFERRRGRAIGFISLISSMGLIAAPPVAQALIDGPGLAAAWMAFGFLALGLGTLPSLLLLVRSPEDMGLQPDGAQRAQAPPQRHSFTATQAVRTPTLWAIIVAVFLISAVMTGVGFLQFSYYTIARGIPESTGAYVVSAFALGFTLGGVTWAPLTDRLPVRPVIIVLYASGVLTMLMMLQVHAPWQAFLAALSFGTLVGGSIQLPTILIAGYYGRAHVGAIGGTVHVARGFGLGSGPVIGGFVLNAFSYEAAWTAFAVFAGSAALLMGFARRPRLPVGVSA
ncbi:MAG: MFS transporter [Chloroflexi bacterium]|nr:MFS transporter [Chloroflexota bacterium]